MKRLFTVSLAVFAVLALCEQHVCAEVLPVSSDEAAWWSRHLVPLPRSISFSGKVRVDVGTVAIDAPVGTDIVIDEAVKELRECMGLDAGAQNPANPSFRITLQIGGADSGPLTSLKNSDQAYRIIPEPGGAGLRVVALAPRGVYYGAKTIQQLIKPRVFGGVAEIPIITVTDWPEFRDRGVWGNDSFARTRWMADRKMNFIEQIAARWFDSNCVGHASAKSGYERMYTEGPYYGVEPCHAVLHMDQHAGTGVFTCYPNLIGVNATYGAWCYSQPEAVQVLAWWISDLKNLPYSQDVDVWMTESIPASQGCKCASCKLTNRNVLEARTIVAAWKKAMQSVGPMGLRILTSEKTRDDNDLIVQELQSEPTVKIWHYDSLLTYMVSEKPVVDSALAQWAAAGRYLGEVPLLSAFSTCFQPWTCPQYVHYRIQEFKSKGVSGLLGYPTPGIAYNRFNTEAAAEWTWNPDGRTPREFAVSWAVREGLPDPELFADWCETMGPVSWDVYGSEYPRGILRNGKCGPIATALKNGTLPSLGVGGYFPAPWGDIKTVTQFNDDVAAATKGLQIAMRMGVPEFYYESLVVHGYITALRALYELKSLVVNGQVAPANRAAAANYFYIYVSGLRQARDAIQNWVNAIGGSQGYFSTSISVLNDEISQMTQLASDLGCPISSEFTLVPVTTIAEAKASPDGTFVCLGSVVVTSKTNGAYIQEAGGRSCGLKLQTSASLTLNQPVSVLGRMRTAGDERYLEALMVIPRTSSDKIKPVALRLRDLGGGPFGLQPAVWEYRKTRSGVVLAPAEGLNNLGLRVRAAGRVTAQGSDYFYLDDGSGCDDGSGMRGVRVICGTFTKPAVGSFVVVTGVSSSYYDRGHAWRAIVVTLPQDIRTLQ
ncbi:MAG: glycoside hydrolase family 20 zincin-like fold domain-containing protein [Armatimonadota bacterium]|nr:glycoside hydrolase family 20 zincin-like fold domain-containing protein [Armatimonadota bacterium]